MRACERVWRWRCGIESLSSFTMLVFGGVWCGGGGVTRARGIAGHVRRLLQVIVCVHSVGTRLRWCGGQIYEQRLNLRRS